MASYRAEVLADSPTAYLRLGESTGTNAADEQAAHAGTYVNAPTLAVLGGVADGNPAVSLTAGSSHRVDWTTLGTLGASLLTCTLECWVKTTTTSLACLMGTVATGTSDIVAIYLNSQAETDVDGSTEFHVRGNSSATRKAYTTTSIYDGRWHHLVCRVDSATALSIFVDGVSQSLTYSVAQTVVGGINFTHAMMIGARNVRGTPDRYATATIDEVAVYPTQLADARIAAHWRVGSARLAALSGVGR